MKKCFITPVFVCLALFASAQNALTLDSCYAHALQQYPLIKQTGLIEKSREYNVSNVRRGYLPQLSINGQATYQSAVTSISVPPRFGLSIPTPQKDQYNIHGEITQTLYDGGNIRNQQELQEATAASQQQNIQVQLYALKDRINQIFFGALLIEAQLKQNDLVQKDIQSSIDKIQAGVNNGTVLRSNLDELEAELMQQQQNAIQLHASHKAYLDMLGQFISRELDDKTVLQPPPQAVISETIKRPELAYYDIQKKSYDAQNKLLNSANLPRLSLFFQGGYARPGLNAFDTNFEPYYIGGLRLSWSLGGLYTLQNSRELLNISKQTLDIEKETFLFNTRLSLKQESGDIQRLQQMIAKDKEIIDKRTAVKLSSKAQLDQGVVTVHDYINVLDAEDQARQNLLLHEVQLLMNTYTFGTTVGN